MKTHIILLLSPIPNRTFKTLEVHDDRDDAYVNMRAQELAHHYKVPFVTERGTTSMATHVTVRSFVNK